MSEGDILKANGEVTVVGGEVKGGSKSGNMVSEKKAVDELRVKEDVTVSDGEKLRGMVLKGSPMYVPMYVSTVDDLDWATKCLVVSVVNGEAIPVLQRRISDAGFGSFLIIPLGADKVILKSPNGGDVKTILSEVPNFFNIFFANPTRWNTDFLVQERGAWARIYGVPLHAWNNDFFKLSVMDRGHLLRVDDITVEKERLDYARVLVSKCSLDILNLSTSLVIDGVLFKLKIIEELGFSLGEDACLLDEDVNSVEENSGMGVNHVDVGDCGDVNDLLLHLSKDWNYEVQQKQPVSRLSDDQGAVNDKKEQEFIDLLTSELAASFLQQKVQPSFYVAAPKVWVQTSLVKNGNVASNIPQPTIAHESVRG